MDIKKKWGLEICEVIPCIWLHVICRMQNVAYQCNGYKLLHRASLFRHSSQHKLINLVVSSTVAVYSISMILKHEPLWLMLLISRGYFFLIKRLFTQNNVVWRHITSSWFTESHSKSDSVKSRGNNNIAGLADRKKKRLCVTMSVQSKNS